MKVVAWRPVLSGVPPPHGLAPAGVRRLSMNIPFDNFQKLGKDQVEATLKTFGSVSKGAQNIAVELADYSKKSFEEGTATIEKLVGAKTLDKAVEIQADYLKNAYEGFIAQSTKLSELYADLAKEMLKPYEGLYAKVNSPAN
jgi:hypothetical protein